MPYKDMREWINSLEDRGLVRRIKTEVNWDREIGAIVRKVNSQEGPALLFENIKGYKNTACERLFTNGLGSRERIALSIGLPRNASYRELVQTVKERLAQPVDSVIVNSGPVKENIIKGSAINLEEFPVPKWHHLDGGRYINTACSVVTRDPETKELNVGTYRGMITGRDTIGVLLASTQHWGMHFAKYRKKGLPMPVAVIYGWDPALFMVSSTAVQHRGKISEFELAGGLRQAPTELVKCETSDLLVPASAEMVVEGRISPDPATFTKEGPFGEYPGYFGGMESLKPSIKVDCITHRNDPIFRGLLEGNSPGHLSEDGYYLAVSWAAAAWNILEAIGVPGVVGVWSKQVTDNTVLRVQIRKSYRGHAKQVANALWGSPIANYAAKMLIVTDEDIDIFDDEAVEWALAYRVNADMGDISFFSGTFGSMLDPSVPLAQRDVAKYGQGKWCRVLIDATINWELEIEAQYGGSRYPALATEVDPESAALVEKRWKEYGI